MTHYVCGFFFDRKLDNVILIWKQKPEWQKGKLNGVGGKIEDGESGIEAMEREFREETGLTFRPWIPLIKLSGEDWDVQFFCGRDWEHHFEYAETKEQEEVAKIEVDKLDGFDYIPNLQWLIPMAIYRLENPKEIMSITN